MKEKEARIDFREHQLILYVEKDDGTYGPIQTGSYISKNYIDDFWMKRQNLEAQYLGKVVAGEITPVAFYMILEELTLPELAARASIARRRVKKHLEPAGYGSATMEELRRYADVFGVPVVNLVMGAVVDDQKVRISVEKTKNPFFNLMKIEVAEK